MFGKRKRFQDTFYPGPLDLNPGHRFATIADLEREYPDVPEQSCAKMPIFDDGELDVENWFWVLPSTRSLVFEGATFYCNPINGPNH